MPQKEEPEGGAPGHGHGPWERVFSRRRFLAAAGGTAVGAGAMAVGLRLGSAAPQTLLGTGYRDGTEPFYGGHQGGILTPAQASTYFAVFDLTAERRSELVELLRVWTRAAARLSSGELAERDGLAGVKGHDSEEVVGLGPARLTLNFGFCPGVFEKDGHDRYGLRRHRPAALVDLPRFPGDQLTAQKTGGDLTVQACADDPYVAFHAVRQLARLGAGASQVRWVQAGFNETPASTGTARNLMGFKDGTINPRTQPQQRAYLWVGSEGPAWMRGGTYLVARRIRMSLEHWDSKTTAVQEQVIGRTKGSGAPLGRRGEFDALDLSAKGPSGNPVIPVDAHVRLSAPENNGGQMILRRSYAYNDGAADFAERWPPWQQALMYDAGHLFLAYQRDPRQGFIRIFRNLAENDAINQFTTHTGSAIAALPRAAGGAGGFVGQGLFGL